MTDKGRKEELANGGLIAREGNIVTLGNNAQWWLNGTPWARNEADATIAHDIHTMRADTRIRA